MTRQQQRLVCYAQVATADDACDAIASVAASLALIAATIQQRVCEEFTADGQAMRIQAL